jgi:hypothetical protein
MSEHRPPERKPPARITWRQARADDPMFGNIFIVPIRTLFAETEPGMLGDAEGYPDGDGRETESK